MALVDDSKIREHYDHLFAKATEIIALGEEHQPIFFVVNESNIVTDIELATALSPDQQAEHFKTLLARPGTAFAVLIHEAWWVDFDPSDPAAVRKIQDAGGASQHPDRREVVVFSFLTPTRQAVMACPIDRATNTVTKRPFEWLPAGAALGRFIRQGGPRSQ
jgi:hypothetical protein